MNMNRVTNQIFPASLVRVFILELGYPVGMVVVGMTHGPCRERTAVMSADRIAMHLPSRCLGDHASISPRDGTYLAVHALTAMPAKHPNRSRPQLQNKKPATTRSRKYVICAARFMFICRLLVSVVASSLSSDGRTGCGELDTRMRIILLSPSRLSHAKPRRGASGFWPSVKFEVKSLLEEPAGTTARLLRTSWFWCPGGGLRSPASISWRGARRGFPGSRRLRMKSL